MVCGEGGFGWLCWGCGRLCGVGLGEWWLVLWYWSGGVVVGFQLGCGGGGVIEFLCLYCVQFYHLLNLVFNQKSLAR